MFEKSVIPEPEDIKFDKNMSEEDFLTYVKLKNDIGLQLGVKLGWWESVDSKGPVPFAKIFSLTEFPSQSMLAHVMVKAKLFETVSDARRNGWGKPIQTGEWIVGKLRYRVKVVE